MTTQEPSVRFLRLKQLEDKVGFKRTTIFRLVKEGHFPQPVKIHGNMTMWQEHEVDVWMRARVSEARQAEVGRG